MIILGALAALLIVLCMAVEYSEAPVSPDSGSELAILGLMVGFLALMLAL